MWMNFTDLSNILSPVCWCGNNPPRHCIAAEESTNTILAQRFLIKTPLPSTPFLNSRFLHSRCPPLPAAHKAHCWQVLPIRAPALSTSDVIAVDKCSSSGKVVKTEIDSLYLVPAVVKKPRCSAGMPHRLPLRYQFLSGKFETSHSANTFGAWKGEELLIARR